MLKLLRKRSGQIMSEYAMVLALFAGIALILMALLAVFTEYGWRIISLVSMDYP